MNRPAISVVLPVHNEARVIRHSLLKMLKIFAGLPLPFEFVICENGSTDGTLEQIRAMMRDYPPIRLEQIPTADYGLALKHALAKCQGEIVFIFNADYWSRVFVRQALNRLQDERVDMVIGSKVIQGARDRRPFLRRWITRGFNAFLRACYGFQGTDTHGLKAFRRKSIGPILARCVTDHFIFDTELVLQAQRQGLSIVEIPAHVRELRQPPYRLLLLRIPKVLWNLIRLRQILKIPHW